MRVTCQSCSAEWGGTNTAHCSGCHYTFTGVTAFDRHRAGHGPRGRCRNVTEAGLVRSDRNYPCWTMPGTVATAPEDA